MKPLRFDHGCVEGHEHCWHYTGRLMVCRQSDGAELEAVCCWCIRIALFFVPKGRNGPGHGPGVPVSGPVPKGTERTA